MDITPGGLVVREILGNISKEQLQQITPVTLTFQLQENPHE